MPAVIAGKHVTIKTDVVNSDIPLLLSRTTMKNASVKMDLEHDRAEIFGQDVGLNLTSSGNWRTPVAYILLSTGASSLDKPAWKFFCGFHG